MYSVNLKFKIVKVIMLKCKSNLKKSLYKPTRI